MPRADLSWSARRLPVFALVGPRDLLISAAEVLRLRDRLGPRKAALLPVGVDGDVLKRGGLGHGGQRHRVGFARARIAGGPLTDPLEASGVRAGRGGDEGRGHLTLILEADGGIELNSGGDLVVVDGGLELDALGGADELRGGGQEAAAFHAGLAGPEIVVLAGVLGGERVGGLFQAPASEVSRGGRAGGEALPGQPAQGPRVLDGGVAE